MAKEKLTLVEFIVFLTALRDTKLLRVVGSYAKGTQNSGGYLSDIDFHVLKDHEGMQRIIEVFNEHGVAWESVITGSINTPRNAEYMFVPIECSYIFTGFKTRPVRDIKICGVDFKAYTYEEK